LYIIVEIDSVKELNRFMNDIYEKYRDKIRTMGRCRKTIVLINGACIKSFLHQEMLMDIGQMLPLDPVLISLHVYLLIRNEFGTL